MASRLTANSTGGFDWVCNVFAEDYIWEYTTPKSKFTEDNNRVKMKEYQRKHKQ